MATSYQRPDSYEQARTNFRKASQRLACKLQAIAIADYSSEANKSLEQDLTIDVAIFEPSSPAKACLMISSGLHGIEGFAGSAIQCHFLDSLLQQVNKIAPIRIVMIHGINPYGFKYLRRWNEDGVDLNRNFLLSHEPYQGSPKAYQQIYNFINPPYSPKSWDSFWFQVPYYILKYGYSSVAEAVATGQYDYPKGLFYGGQAQTASVAAISHHIDQWLDPKLPTIHLDLHTGLGRWQEVTFFLESHDLKNDLNGIQNIFPNRNIRSEENPVFRARGQFGRWLLSRYPQAPLKFITVEFGTYSMLKIFQTLRKENQFHQQLPEDHDACKYWREQVLETFAPASSEWWQNTISQGLDICWQAIAGCSSLRQQGK